MYGERPSTASKAGHGTDLRLILCAPPLAYSDVSWVKDAIPGRPSGQIAPHGMSVLLAICTSLVEYHRASSHRCVPTAVMVIPPVPQSSGVPSAFFVCVPSP